MRIALDGMGGDYAPEAIVAGAVLAVEKGHVRPGQLLITGAIDRLATQLESHGKTVSVCRPDSPPEALPPEGADDFVLVPASQVVDMNEGPTHAMRHKKDSSLLVATRLVKDGHADALCSAGNTGACVAAAMFNLKSLDGVQRPGIAVSIEGERGPFTVIDVGANVFPKAGHLLQYGVMGACLARKHFGRDNPKVGLVNIGGEEGKGNELVKETQELFRDSSLNFVGNVEGQDVFMGEADVLVTEGFLGNVILKLSEGLATHLLHVVKEELVRAGVRPEVLKTGLARITQRCDYSEYGGALLLGVEGIVTICHGRSGDRAIANAIRVSVEAIRAAVNESIVTEIRKLTTERL